MRERHWRQNLYFCISNSTNKVLNIELKENNTLGAGKWDGKKRGGKMGDCTKDCGKSHMEI